MSILNNLRRIWLETQIRCTGYAVVRARLASDLKESDWLLERLEKLHEELRGTL